MSSSSEPKITKVASARAKNLNGVEVTSELLSEIRAILTEAFEKTPALADKPIEWLIRAHDWDLFPGAWETTLNEEYVGVDDESKFSDETLREMCRKCKRNMAVMYDQKQTRSADEPMTEFWKCLGCGAQWKQ